MNSFRDAKAEQNFIIWTLKTDDKLPFLIRTYPVSMCLRDKVNKKINNFFSLRTTRRSNSAYINSLVITNKRDGSVRICLDARKINELMANDYECAEPTEALFQRWGGTKVISTLDLVISFWQIPLTAQSMKYTGFLHEGKCYEFCVTPFGMKTSTAALVRALNLVLRGMGEFVITFIDDMVCISQSVFQHSKHLELLFQRLQDNNITVNFEKSHCFRPIVKFF